MLARGTHVNHVRESGVDPVIAHVLEDKGDVADLQDPDGGIVPNVPRRDPKDYDKQGGGGTYHLID